MCGIALRYRNFRSIKSMLISSLYQQKCCRIGDPPLLGVVVPRDYRPRGVLNLE